MKFKAMRLPIIGLLSLCSVFALVRIGNAVIDFEIYTMDRNAPTINTAPPHFPRPFQHGVRVQPAIPTSPYSICDDACKQRETVFI